MNRIVIALSLLLSALWLPAQDVTYVIFNRECMNQLVYRYAYPNVKGEDPVFAYSVHPNVLENYVFITEGAGHYSPTLPDGAITCKSLSLNDGFVASVNRDARQLLIVFQRQEGGYWLMPVGSATLIARNGSKYWVRSKNCAFTYDTLRLENDVNLAVAGSPTAVYFKGMEVRNCQTQYSFHCESSKSTALRSDIELIPAIGFTSDRTGASSAKALENEMQLSRINGKNIEDFINAGCPEERKIVVSKTQKPTEYGYDKETYGYSEADKEQASIKASRPAEYNYDGQSVAVACPELLGDGYHVVQKGDNLRAIARTYGVDVASLVKWNKLKDANKIEICQIIWYQKPPANASTAAKGVAPKQPTQTTQDKVVDQRKLAKTNNASKSAPVKPEAYNYQDEDYDSWRQKSKTTPKTTPKPQEYEYYDNADNSRPLVHTIKKGEYLYKLAKMYDCPEECIRKANDFPAEGDVEFSIGEKVIIPACDCLQKPKTASKATPYESPVKITTDQKKEKIQGGSLLNPAAYEYEQPGEGLVDPERNKKKEDEWSVLNDEAQKTPSTSTKGGSKTTKEPQVKQFREHLVRQGDNMRSVATKYKVDPSELALVNGLGLNEDLTPGKWILVPIEN